MKDGSHIDANGDKEWFLLGKLHREDGPAVEYANGDKEWFLHGRLHREDGPAYIYNKYYIEWYLNGNLIYCKDKNNLHKYPYLSKKFKQSIIKYKLLGNPLDITDCKL
jgi:hypothetical protein